jgi:hypothetical protein
MGDWIECWYRAQRFGTRHERQNAAAAKVRQLPKSLRRRQEKRTMPEFGCPNREFRMNPNFRAQDLTLPITHTFDR